MAAIKRVKKKEGENLTPAAIEKIIALLEQQKPITKKEACETLNISYNTTRLAKIIEEYKSDKELDEKRRAANRGKPAASHEIQSTIEWYLDGDTLGDIAKRLYRSTDFVKRIIEQVGVPTRRPGQSYADFDPLPEQCISDKFEVGEIAWSSRYNNPCEILKDKGPSACGLSTVYEIYVYEKYEEPDEKFFAVVGKAGFYANQCAYDLGRLTHLKQFGVDVMRAVK